MALKMQRKFNNFVIASNKAIERKSILMSGINRRKFCTFHSYIRENKS